MLIDCGDPSGLSTNHVNRCCVKNPVFPKVNLVSVNLRLRHGDRQWSQSWIMILNYKRYWIDQRVTLDHGFLRDGSVYRSKLLYVAVQLVVRCNNSVFYVRNNLKFK